MREIILDFMKNQRDRWFSLNDLYAELKKAYGSMDFNLRRVRNGITSLRRSRVVEANYAEGRVFHLVFKYRGRIA